MSVSSRKRASSDVSAPRSQKDPRLWNEDPRPWNDDEQEEPEAENGEFLRKIYAQQIKDAQKLIGTAREELRRIHTQYPAQSYEYGSSSLQKMVESLTETPSRLIREQLEIIHVAKAKLRQALDANC